MKRFLTAGLGLFLSMGLSFAQQPQNAAPAPRPVPLVRGDLTGPSWIGHRFVFDRYLGWGWIVPEGEKNWKKGRWVLFEETPGVILAPHRYPASADADNDVEYRLWGDIMPYQGYETNYDIFVDVFMIKGFQVLGQGKPLKLKPPTKPSARNDRKSRSSPISR